MLKSIALALALKLINRMADDDMLGALRAIVVRLLSNTLVTRIELLVAEAETEELPGQDKAIWVQEALLADQSNYTPAYLINIGIESAVTRMKGAK